MTSNYVTKHTQVYQSTTSAMTVPSHGAAHIPVFQLPRNDLLAIPEEEEIREGFLVNMLVQPHRRRRFSGLISIENPDRQAIEKSSTTAVEFRSFSRSFSCSI